VLGLELFFIDSNEFLPAARIFSKTIVGNPVKPSGEAGFTAKAADVLIGTQERLLRQIVCESDVSSSKLTKQAADSGLMPSNKFAESVLVVIDKNSRDKVRISQLHGRRLRYRWRIVLLCIQLPYKQIASADQERNQA